MKASAHKQRGATIFEAALGGAVALVIGAIVISNFKEAKTDLGHTQALMSTANLNAYRGLPQAKPEAKVEVVACDLRVEGSCK